MRFGFQERGSSSDVQQLTAVCDLLVALDAPGSRKTFFDGASSLASASISVNASMINVDGVGVRSNCCAVCGLLANKRNRYTTPTYQGNY